MKHSAFNYVRSLRKRHLLLGEELALLMNQRSSTMITLFEAGDRAPTLEGALALQVIFGADVKAIFPGLYEHVEDAVMRRARLLDEQLEDKPDRRSRAVRELLSGMARREHGNDIIL